MKTKSKCAEYDFMVLESESDDMYNHIMQNKTLYIMKNNRTVASIDSKQLMKMLSVLGINVGDFSNGFKF